MLTKINESEFVVVDLSYARPNVYYEAGYAQGLGKTPVYLAREGTEIPFDLQDYPVIYYPSMRVLRTALADRLNAISSARK
jgi:nucleoside 2-deoxyribosyltransferase